MLRFSRTNFALSLSLLLGAILLPAAAAQAKSVQPKLSTPIVAGQNLTIKGSVKLPAKSTLHGKKLKLQISLKAATGKPQTKSSAIKAKRKAATVKFKVSVLAQATGPLKITAQLYLGKKKFGKASKSKSVTLAAGNPTTVTPAGTPVSVGGATSCALVIGSLKCWGAGTGGELGNGGNANSPTATTSVTGLANVLYRFSIGAGGGCQLVNGYASCWGSNYYGQIGDGKNYGSDPGGAADSNVPVQVPGITGGGISISSGNGHTCAVNNQKIQCWGRNDYGQLGNGTDSNGAPGYGIPNPVDVTMPPQMGTPYSVDVGGLNSCANTSTGIWCWGNNNQGQLGTGTADVSKHHNVPEHVGGVLASTANFLDADLSVGSNHSCVQFGGHAYCWGSNDSHQLGNSTAASESDVPISPDVLPVNGVVSISADFQTTCALALGTAYCWGYNAEGQTGTGSIGADVTKPTPVLGLENGAGSVSVGWFHTCGSKGSTVLCWGANGGGTYLGDGTAQDSGTPHVVQGL